MQKAMNVILGILVTGLLGLTAVSFYAVASTVSPSTPQTNPCGEGQVPIGTRVGVSDTSEVVCGRV